MDCEACEDRLLDLLYGDLKGSEEAEVRASMEQCEGCREAYERLQEGMLFAEALPVVEAPMSMDAVILAAAREKAAELSAARAASEASEAAAGSAKATQNEVRIGGGTEPALPREHDGEGGWWSAILGWIEKLSTGPQVAMATMLLLMVGMGLWVLPQLRQGSELTESGAVVDPDPAGEVGPSSALSPADPLELDMDPRTGRMRPRAPAEEQAPREQGTSEAPGALAAAGGQGHGRPEVEAATANLAQADSAGANLEGEGAEAGDLRRSAAGRPIARALTGGRADQHAPARQGSSASAGASAAALDGAGEGQMAGQAAERVIQGPLVAPEPPQIAETQMTVLPGEGATRGAGTSRMAEVQRDRESGAGAAGGAVMASPLLRPSAPQAGSTSTSGAMSSGSAGTSGAGSSGMGTGGPGGGQGAETFNRGMQRYRARNYTGAIEDFNDVLERPGTDSRTLPAALLHLARSYRANNACRSAIPRYESLLHRFPRHPGTAQAMIELADCYRRQGQLDRADAWLAQAERETSVAAEARRERARLQATRRAREAAEPSMDEAAESESGF